MKYTNRGEVFRFIDGINDDKYCVIVSNDNRKTDKIVNILCTGDSEKGIDVVQVDINGKKKYVHCGCVTYCRKEKIGEKICDIPKEKMDEIDKQIKLALGIDFEEYFGDIVKKAVEKVVSNN